MRQKFFRPAFLFRCLALSLFLFSSLESHAKISIPKVKIIKAACKAALSKFNIFKHKWVRRGSAVVGTALVGGGIVVHQKFIVPAQEEADEKDLSQLEVMEKSSQILDRNGHPLGSIWYIKNKGDPDKEETIYREFEDLENISWNLVKAVVATEDSKFFEEGIDSFLHYGGVDWLKTTEATIKKATGADSGGASTLTQQLPKIVYNHKERNIKNKAIEIFTSMRINKARSKAEILELYLNRINFGSGFYGARAAAKGYFGIEAKDLSLAQAASLAATIKYPGTNHPARKASISSSLSNISEVYFDKQNFQKLSSEEKELLRSYVRKKDGSPYTLTELEKLDSVIEEKEKALKLEKKPDGSPYTENEIRKILVTELYPKLPHSKYKRDRVIQQMHDKGFITQEERQSAQREALVTIPTPNKKGSAMFAWDRIEEEATKIISKTYGIPPEEAKHKLQTEGYIIHSSIDNELQAHSMQALQKGLGKIEESPAFRDYRNSQGKPHQLYADYKQNKTSASVPEYLQGTFVAIDSGGGVLAITGGRDYNDSLYNLSDKKVHTGTLITPHVYGYSFEQGMNPTDLIYDGPTQQRIVGIGGEMDENGHPKDGRSGEWGAKNYEAQGNISATQALASGSSNAPFNMLSKDRGLIEGTREFSKSLGLSVNQGNIGLSHLLVGHEVPESIEDHALAFSTYSGKGKKPIDLRFVTKIEQRQPVMETVEIDGKKVTRQKKLEHTLNEKSVMLPEEELVVIYQAPKERTRQVISPYTAYQVFDGLSQNLRNGASSQMAREQGLSPNQIRSPFSDLPITGAYNGNTHQGNGPSSVITGIVDKNTEDTATVVVWTGFKNAERVSTDAWASETSAPIAADIFKKILEMNSENISHMTPPKGTLQIRTEEGKIFYVQPDTKIQEGWEVLGEVK